MVRGAGCHEINLRIRRREKNVLDIPFYRSGVLSSLRRLFAKNQGLSEIAILRQQPFEIIANSTAFIDLPTLPP
jgi:hypothetical protein